MKCGCPLNCRYCGRRRSKDAVGHYCKTNNCQWQHGYSSCTERRRNSPVVEIKLPRRKDPRKDPDIV